MAPSSSAQRILVIAPHADDEAVGCGGLIRKTSSAGGKVHVAIASERSLDRKWRAGQYHDYFSDDRQGELARASEILGFEFSVLLDGDYLHRLDTVPQQALVAAIEQALLVHRPTLFLLPTPTYDQDHRAVFSAGIAAARPHFWAGTVLLYITVPFGHSPNVFVNISAVLSVKIDACKAYVSQQTGVQSWVSPE